MPLPLNCTDCGFTGYVKDELANKLVSCPKCKAPFRVGSLPSAKKPPASSHSLPRRSNSSVRLSETDALAESRSRIFPLTAVLVGLLILATAIGVIIVTLRRREVQPPVAESEIAVNPVAEQPAVPILVPSTEVHASPQPGEAPKTQAVARAQDIESPAQTVQAPTQSTESPAHAVEAALQIEEDGSDLPEQARTILAKHCYRCHGEGGSNEGGLNFAMQPKLLTEGNRYLKAGAAKDSYLIQRIVDGSMPPEGELLRPTLDEIEHLKLWVDAGALDFNRQQPERSWIDDHQWLTEVHSDLQTIPERSRRYVRYFTSVPLANAGATPDQLATYAHGISKLLNSLSWNSKIMTPAAINRDSTLLRIDLRDYQWTSETWKKLTDYYDYGIKYDVPEATACLSQTECELPFVRTDWFIARAGVPPLYHDILNLPLTVAELEQQLRVPAQQNIEQERVIRAGFNESGISQNNRLIERHASAFGAYWKSYDFGRSDGTGNVFANPLGPSGSKYAFVADGGEMIFNLPNGLQGYFIADAEGRRLDKAPTNIVSDHQQADRAVVNGLSCMSCHLRGIIPKADQVREFVERTPTAFDADSAATIAALFPTRDELFRVQSADAERYQNAVRETGNTISRTESLAALARKFDSALGIAQAAAEAGISEEMLQNVLTKDSGIARILGPLQSPGGVVHRQSFAQIFPLLIAALPARAPLRPATVATESVVSVGSAESRPGLTASPPPDDPGEPWSPSKIIPINATLPDLIFSPDGQWLYLLNASNSCVQRLDMKSLEVDEKTITVTDGAEKMRMHPNGKMLYVAGSPNGHDHTHTRDGKLDIIDTKTWKIEKTRALPFDPWDFVVDDRGLLFFTIGGGQSTSLPVIDSTGKIVNTWMQNLWHRTIIRMLPGGKRFYLATTDLSPATIQGVPMPKSARAPGPETTSITYNQGGRFTIFADGETALMASGDVLRLSTSGAADLQKIGGLRPNTAAVSDAVAKRWILTDRDGNLAIYTTRMDLVVEQRLEQHVYRMAFDPATKLLFCAATSGEIQDPFGLGTGDLHIYQLDAIE